MSIDSSALGYPELLRLATSKGLTELDSTIVQIPSEANGGHGVVLASARTGTGLFRAVGEAWRDTLPTSQQAQTLTVAEVRAKTRALCEAVGMPQPLADAAAPLLGSASSSSMAAPRPATPPVLGQAERPGIPPVPQPMERPSALREEPALRPSPADPAADTGSSTWADADSVRRGAEQGAVTTGSRGLGGPVEVVVARPPAGVVPAPATSAPAPGRTAGGGIAPEDEPAGTAAGRERALSPRPVSRPAPGSPLGNDGIGPDITSKLLQMTRRIAELKAEEMTEEGALERLDSFFQRRFGHGLDQATRMEGQGVVQRLAAEVARLAHAPAPETA